MAASKKVASKLENEIEKYRAECNWEKLKEIVSQKKAKTQGIETLSHLVNGECILEEYLLKHPPTKLNTEKAKPELEAAKNHFNQVIKAGSKSHYYKDALLLLAKLHFALGEVEETLKLLEKVKLEEMSLQELPCTKLKLVAEGYAIKGMVMERQLTSDKNGTDKVKEDEVVAMYEKAGDLAMFHLQEADRIRYGSSGMVMTFSSSAPHSSHLAGPVLETAVQRAPLLHIQQGNLNKGINRFRQILKAVEVRTTQNIRTTIARELAEVLLRAVCQHAYTPPSLENREEKPENQHRRSSSLGGSLTSLRTSSSKGSLKPKMYTTESRPSHCSPEYLFVPKTVDEEALLLLLLSEVQVNRDVVFNRTSEHASSREHAYLHATAVYDLLAIALSRRAQYQLLSEALDRTMKFSFQEFHMWHQFALSLMSAGKYSRALIVFQECAQLEPHNTDVLMNAAKICLQHLHKIDKGIIFARQLVDLKPSNCFLMARGYLLLGIAYGMKSTEASVHQERKTYQKESLKYLKLATSKDPDDYLIHFHTALQLANSRQIPEALQSVHSSLTLNPDYSPSYHLLTLLLSAQKHYSEALTTIQLACKEFPQDFGLQFTKVTVEEICKGPEEAVMTCKVLLEMWKDQEAAIPSFETIGGHDPDRVASEKRSIVHMGLSEYIDRTDTGSVHNSVAASKVEQALSEVASSSSYLIKSGSPQINRIQGQIWLMTAELFLSLKKPEDAKNCVNEAALMTPLSHRLLYVRGLIHESLGNHTEAKNCYESALSINPSHIKSLQNLGKLQMELGNLEMAERVLRTAVNKDPTAHQAWLTLGKVLEAQGEFENASNCLMTGLELEATSPILPFTTIPRIIT